MQLNRPLGQIASSILCWISMSSARSQFLGRSASSCAGAAGCGSDLEAVTREAGRPAGAPAALRACAQRPANEVRGTFSLRR